MMMIIIRTWHIWVIACVFWRWFVWFCVLRLYSRPLGFPSVNSEKTKIEVYCIHFSRLSPVSKFTRKTGLGAILKSPFRIPRNRGFTAPKSESPIGRYIARKQRSTARLQTDARPSRDGSDFGLWATRLPHVKGAVHDVPRCIHTCQLSRL